MALRKKVPTSSIRVNGSALRHMKSFLSACVLTCCWANFAFATTLYADVSHSDYLTPPPEEHATAFSQRLQAQRATSQPPAQQPVQPLAAASAVAAAPRTVPQLSGKAAGWVAQAPTVEWFMVPAWMAGQWTKRGDLTISYTDLRTNETTRSSAWTDNVMTVTWGHQMDRAGNVWHADLLPIERDGYTNGKLARFLMVGMRCENSNPQQLLTRSRYVVSEVYGGTNQLADMFQQEALNQYQQLADGQLENLSSNRIYSYQGQPLRQGELVSKFQKIGAFVPQKFQNNINLVDSLNQYLRSRGLDNLVTEPVR